MKRKKAPTSIDRLIGGMTFLARFAVASAFATALLPMEAFACAVQPEPWRLSEIVAHSEMIVTGTLSYRYDGKGTMRGTIAVAQVIKGQKRMSLIVLHDLDFNPACQPYGWVPPYSLTPKRAVGRFYLFRDGGGTFSIAKFDQTKGR